MKTITLIYQLFMLYLTVMLLIGVLKFFFYHTVVKDIKSKWFRRAYIVISTPYWLVLFMVGYAFVGMIEAWDVCWDELKKAW
jgi:glycopeptide antibiotics resistance protein